MRSNQLVVALLTVAACAPRQSSQSSATQPAAPSRDGVSAALRVAADSFLALNQPAAPGRVWADLSDSTRIETRRRVDRVAASLRRIDRTALTSPTDQLLYDNLRESAEASIGARACNTHLWAISNQFGGWHVAASNAARVQAVGTDDARDQALAVFRALPAAIEAERGLLHRGLDSGYTASRDVIATVIRQYDDLLPPDPTRSPLYAPANRDSTPEFRAAWSALLADTIYPAARAHQAFLRDRYTPRARADGSLSTLPDGRYCYAATLRARTSVEVDVDTIMRNARRALDRITAELAPLVRELTGDTEVSRGVIQLRDDRRFTFPTRDSVLAAYRAVTAHAATRIGRVVAGFQPESIVVTPYPEFQERANLPPQYLRAPDDGSRPAQFLVNLARMERMSVANAVAHEAYPGHHLQRIAARRGPAVHPVMRDLSFGAFTEGWGIYAERLGDEMGLYVTPLDRAGYLVHLLDVAVAAYLDIAYHTRGWSRQQLVDSMVTLGGRSPAMAGAYADRHAATPGQLATYYIGFEAIRSYREAAERTLGTRFRSPEFHREVLKDGTITLASLGAKVDRWVAAQPRSAASAAVDSIPFVLEDARIYVPVSDSAGSLGWFILDTGAQPSGVDVAIADRWQATALDSGLTTGAGGRRTRQSRVPGRDLRIGTVAFRTPTLNVLPFDSLLGAVSGRVVSGLIGSRFFYDHAVTVDFDRRMLYLRPPGSVVAAPGSTTVPFELRSDVPFVRGTVSLPDGRTVDANYMIDIGAKATVLFSEPFLERHRVSESIRGPSFTAPLGAGVGGRTRYRFARVPEIRLGAGSALRWADVVVGLSVDGTLRPSYFDGLFGLEMLTRFIPTFDYATSRMILAPRLDAPPLSEIDLSGLFLVEERSPRAIRVAAIVDSSPATRAGIEVGDQLMSIDGRSAAAMSLAEVRDILRSRVGRDVALRLQRSGVERTRTITLRRMA